MPSDPFNKLARLNAPGIAKEPADVNPAIIAEAAETAPVAVTVAPVIAGVVIRPVPVKFRLAHVIGPADIDVEKSPDALVRAPAAVIVPEAVREEGVMSPSETVGGVPLLTATPLAPSMTTTPSAVLTDKTPDKTGGGGGGVGPGPAPPTAA